MRHGTNNAVSAEYYRSFKLGLCMDITALFEPYTLASGFAREYPGYSFFEQIMVKHKVFLRGTNIDPIGIGLEAVNRVAPLQ